MKLYVEGWIHPKNKIGLDLMNCDEFSIDFNFNSDVRYDWILSLSEFKKFESYDKIIYGPHIMFDAVNDNTKFGKSELFNTLSTWLELLASKLKPNLNCISLPFAVDVDRFVPNKKNGKPVIYYKSVSKDILNDVIHHLGDDFIIFNYDTRYNEMDYLNVISKAPYVIWVGRHESQGFALQESMSCDTPVFVIDVSSLRDEINSFWINYLPGTELKATSASYFDDRCGLISTVDNWKNEINIFIENVNFYNPREFVIDRLSSTACRELWIKKLSNYE
jgi:hypothetical protein